MRIVTRIHHRVTVSITLPSLLFLPPSTLRSMPPVQCAPHRPDPLVCPWWVRSTYFHVSFLLYSRLNVRGDPIFSSLVQRSPALPSSSKAVRQRLARLRVNLVLSGKKCLKELTFPTQPMHSQKNGMKDAPRCATFLYFPFLFISLALPLPPSPCLCLLPLLAALSLLPCPTPSDVALTTREDGGVRQQLLGDVAHVWCVHYTDEHALALHPAGESSVSGMLVQLVVILATAVT
ncbi:hypothetical protein B0H13DRAFT_2347305 [Mycena leptocephala]|nr:hypothetical protein B0H13DRAFT_2347305 [Mycena leptocephala]